MTEYTIRKCLKILETNNKISRKRTNKFSIISIINWDIYQADRQADRQADHPLPKNEKECKRMKKNVKETDNSNEIVGSLLKKEYSEDIQLFATEFIQESKKIHGKSAPKGKKLFENSCKILDELIRLDGYNIDYIADVLKFGLADDFWSKNVRSLLGLRKKGINGCSKFSNVESVYKEKILNKKKREEQLIEKLEKEIFGDNNE